MEGYGIDIFPSSSLFARQHRRFPSTARYSRGLPHDRKRHGESPFPLPRLTLLPPKTADRRTRRTFPLAKLLPLDKYHVDDETDSEPQRDLVALLLGSGMSSSFMTIAAVFRGDG
jgi:hypothetical protein